MEGVETSLDSNLQLESKKTKGEGEEEEEEEGLGEPSTSSSSSKVIIHEDLRQPPEVNGLRVGEDNDDDLLGGVGTSAGPGGVGVNSVDDTASPSFVGVASSSGMGVATASTPQSNVVVIDGNDEAEDSLIVPGPSHPPVVTLGSSHSPMAEPGPSSSAGVADSPPILAGTHSELLDTSGSATADLELSSSLAQSPPAVRMETEDVGMEATQMEIDPRGVGSDGPQEKTDEAMQMEADDVGVSSVGALEERTGPLSPAQPQRHGSASVMSHPLSAAETGVGVQEDSLPVHEPRPLSSGAVYDTVPAPHSTPDMEGSLPMECEQHAMPVPGGIESPEKSVPPSLGVEPVTIGMQGVAAAQSSPAEGASLVVIPEERDRWFSLFPRSTCETAKVVYSSGEGAPVAAAIQPAASVVSPDPTPQVPTQQPVLAAAAAAAGAATPTQQYVYVTPDGQVVGVAQPPQASTAVTAAAAAVPQVVGGGGSNVGYAMVGNTLVPVMGQQPQYVAVNPAGGTTPQQGVQYVLAQQDPQGGMQYFAVGGNPAEGGGAAVGGEAWQAAQQPQFLVMADSNGQQQIMQVVGRDEGGQMLVQVPGGEGQSGGQSGQVVLAAAAPQGGQVVGQGQSGQMVLASQGNQVVVGQGQSGQMILATPQGNQVVLGQGQSGQVVLAAAPQGNQVVVGHGQSGQMVLATPQGNQVVLGQGGSGQVVAAATPAQQQFGHSSAAAGAGGLGEGLGTVDGLDMIRGGQVVKLPDQEQYGILSRDGTKLVLAESKDAAFATLQAASAVSSFLPGQQQSHASPAPPSQSPAPPSQPLHQQVAYSAPKIKEEPQSPSFEDASHSASMAYATPTGVVPTPTPPPSEKATPTTVGLSTSAAETIDLTRQSTPPTQEVSVV